MNLIKQRRWILILLAAITLLPSCATTGTRFALSDDDMKVLVTPDGVEFVRTPSAFFKGLPDWPYESRYVDIDGLRQGYVEAGPENGPVVLMLHGQPSWSYLYRFMVRDLAADGYRAIAMDNLGFGTSDKPIDLDYHTFQNHADRLVAFIEALELEHITLFAQDWGSIIGLYVAGGDLELFDRIVIGNGGLLVVDKPTVYPEDTESSNKAFHRTLTFVPARQPRFFDDDGNVLLPVDVGGEDIDPWGQWVAYAREFEGFIPSVMVEALTYGPLTREEEAAYDAPFPARIAMAGPRTMPGLLDDLIGITEDRMAALETYDRPFLTIFGGNDPGAVGEADGQPWMTENIPGAQGQPHQRIMDASHFLQDDKGPEIADMVDAFIRNNPIR